MTRLDLWIQRWRIAKTRRFVPHGARLLDVGCGDGALFRQLDDLLHSGVGIDPGLRAGRQWERFRLLPGTFPEALEPSERFDVITMLAVLEHIPPPEQTALIDALESHLVGGGLLILTVPSPAVDTILTVLRALRLVHGMSLEQHYGFEPAEVPRLMASSRFELIRSERFQLGLNHLFVFRRSAAAKDSAPARSGEPAER